MDVIIWQDAEGVHVTTPVDPNTINEVLVKDVPPGTGAAIVDSSTLPQDKRFRKAWVKNGNSVSEDVVVAREMYRDEVRLKRKPMLESLDVEYMIADEQGDMQERARIIAEKQRLRDLTDDPRIASASVAQLRALELL